MNRTEQQNKACNQCGEIYQKPYKFSKTQWLKSLYCSRECSGMAKVGSRLSEETRNKISDSQKGMSKPWAGKYKRTDLQIDEARERMYQLHKTHSEKALQASLNATVGVSRTEEFKQNCKDSWLLRDNYKGGQETIAERKRHYEQCRRVKILGAKGSHSAKQWAELKKEYKFTCPKCLIAEPEIYLTKDHIKPVSKGGSNDIKNIQPLCHSCNSKKRTKEVLYAKPA